MLRRDPGLEPGEPRSNFAAERPFEALLAQGTSGEGLALLLPKHTHNLYMGCPLELIDGS